MRKLKLQVSISIDGFIAGPNSEMDWMQWNWGNDINSYVTNFTKDVDTIVIGRKLAEGFIPYWEQMQGNPETADPGSEFMTRIPKIVFTHTLKEHNWPNTSLATGNFIEEVNNLKNSKGGDIIAYGGAQFVSSLIKEGLIDEFYLLVNPAALGTGMPIFKELTGIQQLKLLEARAFDCGITALHYTKP
ncbi:dihydrofolate reductase [Flavobacterium zepuense]|uniref:Dihydrofolate reductase n=1 Tax=Flavobacterium zepuense TaxID=2593302 RepID=A0A552V448_9FLAO|nr:dihydrofolate reductase family protein [Flavobacterium zepuense]TRW25264.1 dihydrofolate reductase [Flavobacterium zepuense]